MEPLQKYGFRDSAYERPNEKWVCGWASEGRSCPRGPDPSGRCPMQSECTPALEGDRYRCTLPLASGGPCKKGPLPDGSCCKPRLAHPPCQPRRSISAVRGRVGWIVAVFTLAAIVVLVGSGYRTWFVSPGELSSAHAAISHGGLPPAQSCAACHAVDAEHGSSLFSAVTAGRAMRNQSQQCLACHFTEGDAAAHALYPHGLPPETLERLTERAATTDQDRPPRSLALQLASLAPSPMHGNEMMACAQCHREHRGRSFDLKYISDTQCQSCHTQQFHSFSRGHPEFRPAPDTPSIIFNHNTHQDTHFGTKPFTCVTCHSETSSHQFGTAGLLMPFEQSCINCHSPASGTHHLDQIRDASVRVFAVPAMEVDEVAAGPWPDEIATGMELPLLMRLLLLGDDAAVEPLKGIREEFWEPEMWFPDDPDETTQLAISIKRAMHDLLVGDERSLTERLSVALDLDGNDRRLVALVRAMVETPLPEMLEAQPAIQQFMKYGEVGALDAVPNEAAPREGEFEAESGWFLTEIGEVEYRQPAHADPFYTALLEALAAAGSRAAVSTADEVMTFRAEVRREFWDDLRERGPFASSCLKCHSVSDDGRIAWQPPDSSFQHPSLAFSSRDPHLILHAHEGLGEAQQCIVCHVPKQRDNTVPGPDWLNFNPLTRESCADCHNKLGASQSCITCHTYHRH